MKNTKKIQKDKEKNFTFIPLTLMCDKNVTFREKSLLLAHFLHTKNDIKNVKYISLSSLALRWSNFKTNVPPRKMMIVMKALQEKGYIRIINNEYSVINREKYEQSAKSAVNSSLFHDKRVDFRHLLLLFLLSHRSEKQDNCIIYLSKAINLDRNTVSKYLKSIEKLGFISPLEKVVNGKRTKNFHLNPEYKPLFVCKPKHVNNPSENPVKTFVPISAQIDYYFLKKINRIILTAKLEKLNRMFTLNEIIDSKSKEIERLIKAIKTNLYFKNKLVSEDEIKAKLQEIALDMHQNNVIKVFQNQHHFINFTTMLFKTSSYPLEKGIKDEMLLREIQDEVFIQKNQRYSFEYIRWLATKIFKKDFVIYHVNIFKNRLVEALLDEKKTGEETQNWSEESFIDWDEVHRQEKLKYSRF
jgi:DNA-binding MarR family transcriptional regulator